jgi:hypothetical protein
MYVCMYVCMYVNSYFVGFYLALFVHKLRVKLIYEIDSSIKPNFV